MVKTVPKSSLARTGVAGLAVVKSGAVQLKHLTKRPFLSRTARQEADREKGDELAQILFQALSHLRGTALKIAQMLSMDMGLLPEPYRRELAKAYHRVPPLNRTLIRKVLIENLGQPPEDLFAVFEPCAFAAASLGQVHRARTHGGEELAIKIQYPGIHVTIENDLRLLRGLLLGLPQSDLALPMLEEIRARLREEVDYRLEARNGQWFRTRLEPQGVHVPRVYPELSGERVLGIEYLPGLHLDEWLAQGHRQEDRDRLAQGLFQLGLECLYGLRRIHADPNPGNYLFMPGGEIGLLDFGCVRHISDAFTRAIPQLLQSYERQDREATLAAYRQLGMLPVDGGNGFYEEVLRPFGAWVSAPYAQDAFDFAAHPGYAAKGFGFFQRIVTRKSFNRMAEEFVFFNRSIHGLYLIFERLGARVRLREPMAHMTGIFLD